MTKKINNGKTEIGCPENNCKEGKITIDEVKKLVRPELFQRFVNLAKAKSAFLSENLKSNAVPKVITNGSTSCRSQRTIELEQPNYTVRSRFCRIRPCQLFGGSQNIYPGFRGQGPFLKVPYTENTYLDLEALGVGLVSLAMLGAAAFFFHPFIILIPISMIGLAYLN